MLVGSFHRRAYFWSRVKCMFAVPIPVAAMNLISWPILDEILAENDTL
jgi:hypothetical protein